MKSKLCVNFFYFIWILKGINEVKAYYQNDYDVRLDRFQIMKDYNRTYASKATGGLFWYNRTERVINIDVVLLKPVGPNLITNVQVYKFLSNEFRFFPITLSLNICEEYSKNTFGLLDMFRTYSNIKVDSCPLQEGTYWLKNAKLDFSQFPPHIPRGTYKVEVKLYNKHDYLGQFDVIADISTKGVL